MKKLLTLIMLFATLLAIPACGDNNEPENVTNLEEPQIDNLVGTTWTYKNTGENSYILPDSLGGGVKTTWNFMAGFTTFIEFEENNKVCAYELFNTSTETPDPIYSNYTRKGGSIQFNPPLTIYFDNHDTMMPVADWGITRCEVSGKNLRVYYSQYYHIRLDYIYLGEEYVNFRKQE